MDFIKKYRTILIIIIPILILVIIRALGTNHFRSDAGKLAEPSFSRNNIITAEKADQITGEKLLLVLGKDVIKHNFTLIRHISADSVLEKENLKMLRNHDGPVLIYSGDISISSRIWMLLSQMGFRDLYILSDDADPEALKYKFRPDTTSGPEL